MNYEEFEIEDPFFFLDDIEVDQNLFAQIQEYVQGVQADPNTKKELRIDLGDIDFSVCSGKYLDTTEMNRLAPDDTKKSGIILWTSGCCAKPEAWKEFINSELFTLCEINSCYETEDGKKQSIKDVIEEEGFSSINELLNDYDWCDGIVTFLNFPFNTTPLCKTIQYLAKHFNCPLDKIKITVDPNDGTTNTNSSNSNSNGCFGMLALMISIGGAGIYGLIELASKLIV